MLLSIPFPQIFSVAISGRSWNFLFSGLTSADCFFYLRISVISFIFYLGYNSIVGRKQAQGTSWPSAFRLQMSLSVQHT